MSPKRVKENPDNSQWAVSTAQIQNKRKAADFLFCKMLSMWVERISWCFTDVPLNVVLHLVFGAGAATGSLTGTFTRSTEETWRPEGWRTLSLNLHPNGFSARVPVETEDANHFQ